MTRRNPGALGALLTLLMYALLILLLIGGIRWAWGWAFG
jgi:hypothetical protein